MRLVGVIYRGNDLIEGIIQDFITVDGNNATNVIIELIKNSKFHNALKVIMLYGITFGGFNMANPKKLHDELDLPVIVIAEKKPDLNSMKEALTHLKDGEEKWKIILNNSDLKKYDFKEYENSIYFTHVGMNEEDVRQIIKFSIKTGRIPEPIRIAHMIASSYKQRR